MTVLLETVHGSYLYGLDHCDSDLDTYRVISRFSGARPNRVRHQVDKAAGTDVTTVGLSTFMHHCEEGVPQALEAMFSPVATIDSFPDLRAAYRVGSTMRRTYMRTAKNFAMSGEHKKQRHALRLLTNLWVGQRTGRFNPVLNHVDRIWLNLAMEDFEQAYEKLLREV